MYFNGLIFISRLIKPALWVVLVGVCISINLSAIERGANSKKSDFENSKEQSLISSSSSPSSQEDYWMKGAKLTVHIEAIREHGSVLLERIRNEHPNIQEIQVIRRSCAVKIAGRDIQFLGQHFSDVTVLRLNNLGLRQTAVNVFSQVDLFPDLSELYLDDNGSFNNVEILAQAPFYLYSYSVKPDRYWC